ncbi:MAG TPA: hypothetical protein VJO35_11020 [Terriglobales bacterium]|nr:hypothetical protein [Terriglobales bacterium]
MTERLSPHFVVLIAVAVGFALARRYFPPPRTAELPKGVSIEELNDRFRSVRWAVGFGMVLVGAIFVWATHQTLVALNLSFAYHEGPARFILLPSPAIWWFLPGLGALALCWELSLSLWRLFGNVQTVRAYVLWTNMRAGFDTTKVLRWIALLFVAPIGLLTLVAIPMHTTVHDDGIKVRGYASWASVQHLYPDARRLAVVDGFRTRHGGFTARAAILLKFADGYEWSSGANRDFTMTVDQNLLDFLQGKTQLPVERALTEADLNSGRFQ